MRYAAILLLPLLFICSCASQETRDDQPTAVNPAATEDSGGQAPAPEPEAEKQRLAVLDMEDTTGDIDAESLAQATDYLRVLVVQSQRFIVVSDEEKQALIRELRKESHGEQYDETQRVPLGQRVAANVALITTILKIQEDYILKAELVDLAKEAIIAGATEKFLPDTFQQAIEAVAQAVTTDKKEPADTMVATAPAQEATPADIPVDGDSEIAADYANDEHHDHDGGGVNFVIINLVSSRHGREPDPYYRSAEERRREREARRREEAARRGRELPTIDDVENPTDSIRNEASSGGRPPEKQAEKQAEKPIQFKLVKKPILFHAPEKKKPSSITLGEQPEPVKVHPKATREKSAPAYTLPSKKEKETPSSPSPVFRVEPKKSAPEPVRVEPKKSESTFFKRAPSNESQPVFKKETPSSSYKKSEPSTMPRPIFTPSKSAAPSKSVTHAPSSSSSSSKKKKNDDDDDDDDDKKKEKKKPSTGNIFIPRKR